MKVNAQKMGFPVIGCHNFFQKWCKIRDFATSKKQCAVTEYRAVCVKLFIK